MKYYLDLKNSLDTARDTGKKEGSIKKSKEIARKMILKGMEMSLISEMIGLTEKEINELK